MRAANQRNMMHPMWDTVMGELKRSIYAEQVFCSITTEMRENPGFNQQPGLETVHRENYETSYHRNTACGNLIRLHFTAPQDVPTARVLTILTIDCFYEANHHDKQALAALIQLQADGEDDETWLDLAKQWHDQRSHWLRCAKRTLRSLVPQDVWAEAKAKAEIN